MITSFVAALQRTIKAEVILGHPLQNRCRAAERHETDEATSTLTNTAPCSRCKPPTLADLQASEPTAEIKPTTAPIEELALPYCNDPSAIQYYAGFALLYSEEHEQAAWVAYLLTDNEVLGTIERSDNFREDHQISTGSASLWDYRGSGL